MGNPFNPEYPNLNVDLLRRHVEWVEAQDGLPEGERDWDQGYWLSPKAGSVDESVEILRGRREWDCGTYRCLAGNIALEGGGRPASGSGVILPDGQLVWVEKYAAELLGIDRPELAILFDSLNTAVDIRREAERLAGGPL